MGEFEGVVQKFIALSVVIVKIVDKILEIVLVVFFHSHFLCIFDQIGMLSSRIHILAAAISVQILNFLHKRFILVFTASGHNNSFPQFYGLYFRNGQFFHRFGVAENIRVDYFIVELVDFIVGFFQFLCKGAVCIFLPVLSEH